MTHTENMNHLIDGDILLDFWQGKDYIFGYLCFLCSTYVFIGVILLKLVKQLQKQKYGKLFNFMKDSLYN
jgi:hypothetical protein